MHHRKYDDTTLFHGIEDAVWEAPYKATMNTRLKLWPGTGKVNDVLNGVVYLNGEVIAETLLAAFVVLDGLLELDLRKAWGQPLTLDITSSTFSFKTVSFIEFVELKT